MRAIFSAAVSAIAVFVTGCQTVPPGVERGPQGTIPYEVSVEASEPGARIEANGEVLGATPLRLKIYGDKDGTFHDFGSYTYVIRALPLTTNQHAQIRVFQTGRWMSPEDRIPQTIYFDMNQPPPAVVPGPSVYVYPPAPYYYGPSIYLGPRYHYGPSYYDGSRHHGGPGLHFRR